MFYDNIIYYISRIYKYFYDIYCSKKIIAIKNMFVTYNNIHHS